MQAQITVVGLGPAGIDLLPTTNLEALRTAARILVRTERHPAVEELRAQGLRIEALDRIYQEADGFADLYPTLAREVLAAATAGGALVYAVPGHPLLGEESVRVLLREAQERGVSTDVLAAPGFVDVVATALARAGELPDLAQWQVVDALVLEHVWWEPGQPALIFQVEDRASASKAKLTLLEEYPDEHPVFVVRHAGERARESVTRLPLHRIDHEEAGPYDHLCTLYVPPISPEQRKTGFPELVDVVAALRGPNGCPWDREQTYKSLKRFVLEEAYEVLEAIDSEDPDHLAEELGDLLLQVVLLAQVAKDDGFFDIRDVAALITEKLIRRHPHVFGDVDVANSDEVLRNWEAIKRTEKPERESVLDGVPKDLPALMKALEVSKRVVKVGFEWPSFEDVLAKLDEEVAELRAELRDRDPERLRAEVGDLLFTVVNIARWLKVDPEEALRQMVERFGGRFRQVERLALERGLVLKGLGIQVLDQLWDEAKSLERRDPSGSLG